MVQGLPVIPGSSTAVARRCADSATWYRFSAGAGIKSPAIRYLSCRTGRYRTMYDTASLQGDLPRLFTALTCT